MSTRTSHTETLKTINPEYTDTLINLWDCAKDMMTHTQNELGEIYRISKLVRFYASYKAKVDALRDTLADATAKRDIYSIKRVSYLAQRYQEEKSFDKVWGIIASDFDQMVNHY